MEEVPWPAEARHPSCLRKGHKLYHFGKSSVDVAVFFSTINDF